MLRRRTVLTAGLGLLGACDPRPASDATPDLAAVALAERAASIHDAPPPRSDTGSELLLAADLGSARTWDAAGLLLLADGRACLRRTRTAVTTTIAAAELASLDAPLAEHTGDARARHVDGARHGRPRSFHGHGKQITIVGEPADLPPSLAFLDAEVARLVERLGRTVADEPRLIAWHARSHLASAGAFDDELWVFADGQLVLRHDDGKALPTFATRRVDAAALAFLTVALGRPIPPTDTVRPAVLAPGTGHKFLLASLEREMLVQPGEPLSPGLEAVLREALWLRRAFA